MFARVAATGVRKQDTKKPTGNLEMSHTQQRVLEDMEHFFDRCFDARKPFRRSVDRLLVLNTPLPEKERIIPQTTPGKMNQPKEILEELEELDAKHARRREAAEIKLNAKSK
jgi:hypothetical protein